MSYPAQWAAAPQGANVPSQGDMLSAQALFNSLNQGAHMRQAAAGVPMNQSSPNQAAAAAGYCPNPGGGFSLVYPQLLAAAVAAQASQSRQAPAYCFPQGFPQNSIAAAAAVLRGSELLPSPSSYRPQSNMPVQSVLGGLPYYQVTNGLPLAAFPGSAPFSHNSSLAQRPQHTGAMRAPPFRSYDSLRHFGALPQQNIHKRNKSMTTSKTNLYICGLSESDTDETVRALVEDVVRPKSCKAMLLNGKCKGSGFIDCATEDDALKALTHLNEIAKTSGRNLYVKYALENEKDLLNVYVRNLPKTGFTKETLESLFRQYGQVTSVKLLETDGVYTGIGFVRFATAEQAQLAVQSMNESRCVLDGGDGDSPNGGKPICCKLADKADPRRRPLTMPGAVSPVPQPTRAPKPHHHHHIEHNNSHHENQQFFQPEYRHPHAMAAHPHNHPLPQLVYSTHDLMAATALCSPPLAAGSYGHSPGLNNSNTGALRQYPPSTGSATAGPMFELIPSSSPHGAQNGNTSAENVEQQQQQLFAPAPCASNGIPCSINPVAAAAAAASLDSRYAVAAAQLAAAAISHNGVANSMYSPMAVTACQFSRVSQPMVQTTYTTAFSPMGNGQFGDQAFCSPPQPSTIDMVNDHLQSLSLRTQQILAAVPPHQAGVYQQQQRDVDVPQTSNAGNQTPQPASGSTEADASS